MTASMPAHSASADFPGAGAATEADDADVLVHEQVERDPLLGTAAVQAEGVAVATHEAQLLVGADPSQAGAGAGS